MLALPSTGQVPQVTCCADITGTFEAVHANTDTVDRIGWDAFPDGPLADEFLVDDTLVLRTKFRIGKACPCLLMPSSQPDPSRNVQKHLVWYT